MILLGGALSFGMHELLGVRQVLDWYSGRQPRPLPLKTQGLYRWLRHPMYVGVVLAVWATPYMTVGHALLAAGLTVYVMIARRYEERDLGSAYGCAYQAWSGRCSACARTPPSPALARGRLACARGTIFSFPPFCAPEPFAPCA